MHGNNVITTTRTPFGYFPPFHIVIQVKHNARTYDTELIHDYQYLSGRFSLKNEDVIFRNRK